MRDPDRLNAQARRLSLAILVVVVVTFVLVAVLVDPVPVAALVVGVVGYGTAAVLAAIGVWNAFLRIRTSSPTQSTKSGTGLSQTLRRHWPVVLIVTLLAASVTVLRVVAYLR